MINKDVSLAAGGIRIEGRLYLPGGGDRQPYPAVCICHGIPSGIPKEPGEGGYPAFAERICREGFAVFIFSFRGTGSSGGNLDMAGWMTDLRAAVDYLCALDEIDGGCLTLLGFSAGAAVSVCVASEDSRVSAVIGCACPAEFGFEDPLPLIGHFRSIGVIRDTGFPGDAGEWLEGFGAVSPVEHIAGIATRPLLLVHGNLDDVVDVSQAYRLYAAAKKPRHLIVVDGANHRIRHNDRAMAIVIDWLKSLKPTGFGKGEKQ